MNPAIPEWTAGYFSAMFAMWTVTMAEIELDLKATYGQVANIHLSGNGVVR